MKTFRSEYINDYSTYTFGYTEYAVMQSQSDIPAIYDNGFLPYTGNTDISQPVFYLARSLRVRLEDFSDSSENRRVNRKFSDTPAEVIRHNIEDFDIKDKKFTDFCLDYAKQRFSNGSLDGRRLNYILSNKIATDIFEIKVSNSNTLLGYIIAVVYANTFHYWFSFYNTVIAAAKPLGKWLMWKMIRWAQEEGLEYIYLGTAYGPKALYKVRDFKALEFFDGNFWNDNTSLLKQLCKGDEVVKKADLFKLMPDPGAFIDKILKK